MLSQSERRAALFESIMDSMGESVLVVDREGKELYGNRELRRFRGEVSPGHDLNSWRRPDRMKIFDADGRELAPEDWPVARALRGDYKTNFEIRVQGMAHTPDEVVLAISTRSLVDPSGNIEGAVIVTRDITAMRQTEEKLRQSQKLETIGQLTGGVAHDFNNMLAAILSSVEVVKRGVEGNVKLEMASSTIEKAAMRGADLTRHLLAFARKQTLCPVRIDLNDLVSETLLLVRPALGATVNVEVKAGQDVFALADPAQLTSALLNLCINARDAMGEAGGPLVIEVSASEDKAQLSVRDTGCGMSPETLARAVEPFFTTKGVGKGSGLGLSMVFGFARQSGGDVRIESTLGKGTTVAILLPRASGAEPVRTEQSARTVIHGLRVLVVDDDDLVREALALQLRDGGYEAFVAKDAVEALEMIENGLGFDLLLTDMVMPRGMSGLDLAKAVRAHAPNARVVISTGYVEKKPNSEGGVQNWSLLRKPYTAEDLFNVLREATSPHN